MPQHSQKTKERIGRLGKGSVPRAKEIAKESGEGESIKNPLKSEISKEHSKKNVK